LVFADENSETTKLMRIPKHLLTPPTTPLGALPAVTLALAAAGVLTSANAQLQTAGDLLVNVNATALPAGPLVSIPNTGTLGGVFEAIGGGDNNPLIAPINSGGTPGIRFGGDDYLQHVMSPGGAKINAPAGLVGPNPTSTVEVWVYNPVLDQEETVLSWGKRGGPDGSNKSLNFGFDSRWGAIGHWGAPDIGWDPCCNDGNYPPLTPTARQWHHLVWTYDGTTTRVYSDGVLRNSEALGLNTAADTPITIAAQLEADGVTVTGALRGSMTIARVRIHDEALTDAQVLNNYNVEAGEFTAGVGVPPAFGPVHRYSFDAPAGGAPNGTALVDSVGGANGSVVGDGATFTGTRATLPGGGSGLAPYLDLPNGMLSKRSQDNGGSGKLTLEGWVKVTGSQTWSRIFDIGSSQFAEVTGVGGGGEGTDYFTYTAQNNTDLVNRQLETRNVDPVGGTIGGGNFSHHTDTFNQDFHFAITWDEATGQQTIYENGVIVGGRNEGARLSGLNDVNVWLGRSQWNGDANMQGEFDEFRIYDRVPSTDEVRGSFVAGSGTAGAPQPCTVVQQPQSITVQETLTANFSVAAQGQTPYTFQWYKNGAPVVGAVSASYSFITAPADDNATFYCAITHAGGVLNSATATLDVTVDVTPPSLVGAAGGAGWGLDETHFGVRFSEAVNEADAENVDNYSSIPSKVAVAADYWSKA
jgi:hypothetical protein